MPISDTALARWSRHQAGTAFKQAHVPIREALEGHKGLSRFKYEVVSPGLLQERHEPGQGQRRRRGCPVDHQAEARRGRPYG